MSQKKTEKTAAPKSPKTYTLGKRTIRIIIASVWLIFVGPFLLLGCLLLWASAGEMPPLEELVNPKSHLASEIYFSNTTNGSNELMGKYFTENRSNVSYSELSPHLVDCLIATEDERFMEHTGVDYEALGRVVKGVITRSTSQGGGSTITQQLAKNLFKRAKMDNKFGMLKTKLKEWIIATKLERNFTKREIITMYLNTFDFLNNAVGIKSAARVYFNTTPDSLTLEQSAMLIGMAKNPSQYNPVKYPENAKRRREVVLKQLLKNNGNEAIKYKLTEAEYHKLRQLPIVLNYQKVDHVEGPAPYFREELKKELTKLFAQKNADGSLKYHKKDGTAYDIYKDGLKIYTTLDSRMQKYGEYAVQQHLGTELQKAFDKDNKKWKRPPFANHVHDTTIVKILRKSKRNSNRYKIYIGKICGYCERSSHMGKVKESGKEFFSCGYCKKKTPVLSMAKIDKMFETPFKMKVFSWYKKGHEFDTIMTPKDSILYYQKFLQAGLISIDPHTGFIKAWVGGADFRYFKFDNVRNPKQVGSTFKPFVYAAAFRDRIFSPCSEIPDIEHCIEVPYTATKTKPWCPSNSGMPYTGAPIPLYYALPASMNNITAGIIKDEKPYTVIKMLEQMGIPKGTLPAVPSICLGVCELSPRQMTGAQATFANNGIFIEPIMFTRIEDKNGNVIYDVEPKTSEAMDAETAYMMLMVMKGACSGVTNPHTGTTGGTAMRIRQASRPYGGIKTPIAGKTGTTENQADGWFMGLTPDLVTGVWVGCDNNGVHFTSTSLGMGTNMALPIWGYYMKKVYADKTLKISTGDFEKPEGFQMFDCADFKIGNSELWNSIDIKEVETDMFKTREPEEPEEDPLDIFNQQ